jgi:hypothetical protein
VRWLEQCDELRSGQQFHQPFKISLSLAFSFSGSGEPNILLRRPIFRTSCKAHSTSEPSCCGYLRRPPITEILRLFKAHRRFERGSSFRSRTSTRHGVTTPRCSPSHPCQPRPACPDASGSSHKIRKLQS